MIDRLLPGGIKGEVATAPAAERCTSTYAGTPCDLPGGHDGSHCDRVASALATIFWTDAAADKWPCESELAGIGCTQLVGHVGPHRNGAASWSDAMVQEYRAEQARDLAGAIEANPTPLKAALLRRGKAMLDLADRLEVAVDCWAAGETERCADQLRDLEDTARSIREEMESGNG